MKTKKIKPAWLLLILIAVLVSACQPTGLSQFEQASTYAAQTKMAMPEPSDTPEAEITTAPEATQTATAEPTPIPTVGQVGPSDFPENVNPLTGLVMSDLGQLNRRPVIVKVANYPTTGRPHAGLSFADIVFEYYLGAGSNRFMGVYYGQDAEQIGPVRSGRLVDPQIVSMYQGILGMESAYITIKDHIVDILDNRVVNGRSTCPAICDDGRQIVISVFADSAEMTKYTSQRGVDNRRFNLDGMAFDIEAPTDGGPGEEVNILYTSLNRGEWRFDEESGKYLRWIEENTGGGIEMIPLVDRITDEQLAFSNVIVLFAHYEEYTEVMHDIFMWDNQAGQRAVIFRDGLAYESTWVSPSRDHPIQFYNEDGEVFPLKPGNTWISIFGLASDVEEDDGEWTFRFDLP
ncbi:MAG: DUF3048 domain-containing protein [Brevefilum sp.]|nr:DUF3048 domain-containing protein [Brevefilum sp.]MDT8382185.1 DUF3048 domain-containing protein [Brevefilum sp.]MDW7755405.1 DUF3048 domain-containing protein [Brevefilum sp.]